MLCSNDILWYDWSVTSSSRLLDWLGTHMRMLQWSRINKPQPVCLNASTRATWSLDGAERSEAERWEDPTDVVWITASTSQADRLSAPSGDNYVVFNGWHSVYCKWSGCHFGRSADIGYTRLVRLPCSFFQLRQLWSVRRSLTTEATLVQALISNVVDSTTAILFWSGSLMFIFSDSSLCRTQQPAWSPELVVTTTSRRFSLVYTGFQYASELSTRRLCLCGTAYMMQPLAIWLTCVCRPIPCMVASNCISRRLGLCWFRTPGLLPVSAASPSMDHEHGTICQLNSEHQMRLCAPSNVISRPTCFNSSLHCCWQVGSAPFVWRRCDCLASSVPTTNIQPYLLTYGNADQ